MFFKYTTIIVITAINYVHCSNIKSLIESKRSELDPEIFFNSTEMLQKYYYTTETHVVRTEDGYILNILRVKRSGPPILLVHGIGDSSDGWVVLGPKYSLAFLLADAGYDVWLFNCRGNKYNRKHSRRIPLIDYWNFSFEEIGSYDLPATVDFILSRTRYSKLTYIGYSQGCTTFFILCSLRPEYNSKINHAILLAPVAWLANMKHPNAGLLAQNLNELTLFFKKRQIYSIANATEINKIYHAKVCNLSSPINILCILEIHEIFGLNRLADLVPGRIPIIVTHTSSILSTNTLLHFVQLIVSKRFCRFDFGEELNKLKYSSSTPPDYNVSLISVPMTMFVSEADWFSSPEDVKILQKHLRNRVKYIGIDKAHQFTHIEFIYGSRINTLINIPVLKILNNIRY